jgi:hypothetical protein
MPFRQTRASGWPAQARNAAHWFAQAGPAIVAACWQLASHWASVMGVWHGSWMRFMQMEAHVPGATTPLLLPLMPPEDDPVVAPEDDPDEWPGRLTTRVPRREPAEMRGIRGASLCRCARDRRVLS